MNFRRVILRIEVFLFNGKTNDRFIKRTLKSEFDIFMLTSLHYDSMILQHCEVLYRLVCRSFSARAVMHIGVLFMH